MSRGRRPFQGQSHFFRSATPPRPSPRSKYWPNAAGGQYL